MASPQVRSHPTTSDTLSGHRQDTTGTAIAIILPADVGNAVALDFDVSDVIELIESGIEKCASVLESC